VASIWLLMTAAAGAPSVIYCFRAGPCRSRVSAAGGLKFDFMSFACNRQLQPMQGLFLTVVVQRQHHPTWCHVRRRITQLRRHGCPGDIPATTARRSHAVMPLAEIHRHLKPASSGPPTQRAVCRCALVDRAQPIQCLTPPNRILDGSQPWRYIYSHECIGSKLVH